MIHILHSYQKCGLSSVEQDIQELVGNNPYITLKGLDIKQYLQQKAETVVYPFQNEENYHIYFAYHPSSSYYTEITEENGEPQFHVKTRQGGSLCAFFSEIIVFTIEK